MDKEREKNLITGGDDHFLPVLLNEINSATEINIAVAFMKSSGFKLIQPALMDSINSGCNVRILTSDYLQVTEPMVLRQLMLLKESGAKVFVFETDLDQSFHLKTYIFIQGDEGSAYVGSSNISKSALLYGIEWNLRVSKSENLMRFTEIQHQFERLLAQDPVKPLTHKWIDQYQELFHARPLMKQTVPDQNEQAEIPLPNSIQQQALQALDSTRKDKFSRGLVVLATGMGKTWLSAFDSRKMRVRKILFVAHREEILIQAEETFTRIQPELSAGRYDGNRQEENVDMLFASIQTIGKFRHLEKFHSDYFDYIVVDEFHHAAASTYRKLLGHFQPRFLLGLTATPDRTDQADILSLCDNNLVFTRNLFDGIELEILCPFRYFGIGDNEVDYSAIPWRNGKFDTEQLVNQLATYKRADHVLSSWNERKQDRTLAFCISQRHADFMAEFFSDHGIPAVSVHSNSKIRRNEAIEMLRQGTISVLFSVDLFNEGVDIPVIDTILMLRPTESTIVFLQQLGRGLRTADDKDHLVILDFIGNHKSFFRKAEALFKIGRRGSDRKEFLEQVEAQDLSLPPGCFVNYDLNAINIMKSLLSTRIDVHEEQYSGLYDSFGRRPSLVEFVYSGGSVNEVRKHYGQWHKLPEKFEHLDSSELDVLSRHTAFLQELETSHMSKCFKMVLLEAFTELSGFQQKVSFSDLAKRSFEIFHRRPAFQHDLPYEFRAVVEQNNLRKGYPSIQTKWERYWRKNPINAWIGGNSNSITPYFVLNDQSFSFMDTVNVDERDALESMVLELIDYKYYQYESRYVTLQTDEVQEDKVISIPFFSDLELACGYFSASEHRNENIQNRSLSESILPQKSSGLFIARTKGDSMNSGENPILNDSYILMSQYQGAVKDIPNGTIVAVQSQREDADSYSLKMLQKSDDGMILTSTNPEYSSFPYNDDMLVFALFDRVLGELDFALHKHFLREEIPGLFGLKFNPGIWNMGHVCPGEIKDQILLVTLNKQGKVQEHRYHDYFIDESTFHWQSQNSVAPGMKRGQQILNHVRENRKIHLFIRKNKLEGKTAAPFIYMGPIQYSSHSGSKPMSVEWKLEYRVIQSEFLLER